MARTYNDIKNRKKKKDEEESKDSALKSESRVDRMARKRQEISIGFDTLSSDLNSLNSNLSGILGGWQSSDTMNSTKADVEKMYNRLGAYEDYRSNYGGNSLPDMSELLGAYESTLGELDTRSAQYGQFKNADAYNAEQDTLKRLYSMDSNEIAHQMANGAGRNKSVAYTTASGYNIKWEDLYNDANALETEQRVKKNADFSETSKFKKKDVKYTTTLSGHSVVDDDDAHLYNYINGDEEAKDHETLVNVHMYGTSDTPMYERFEPEEKAVFNSLWETEGPEAAKKYAEVLSSELRKRRVEYERQIDAQNAKENPFGSSVASVIANVGNNALALPFLAMDYLDDNNIDPNSSLYGGRRFVNTTRGTVENDVIDNEVGRFFYRHGMNTADNLAVQAVSGFGMLGGVSKVAQTAIMSAGSFVDTAIDAKERGLTDVQALSLGTIAGAAEMFFESKSFDALFGGDNLSNGALGYFLDNLKTELVGELGTELTNDVADFIIAQDMNQWKMSIDSYVKSGLTEKEALSKTIKDNAIKYLDVAAGTIFSTGVMTGPQAIKIQAENVATGKSLKSANQVSNVFDMASMSPEESQAYEAYTRYANKGVTADNISNAKLGSLYNLTKAEVVPGINKAYKDREKATGIIGKQVDIMTSDKASERKIDNASKKADIAAKQYKNAQTAIGKYENNYKKIFEVEEKVSDAKYIAETKAEAKKISADVETSVIAESNEAVDFKGVEFDGKDTKIITNDGKVSINDVKLSETDAHLITIAKDMEANVANAFVSAYDRSSNVDVEQYLNDFNLVSGYAVNERFTPEYILQHRGSLTEKQAVIIADISKEIARQKEAEFNKLISTTANNTPYKGVINDSIFKNGTVNYNRLDKRQKNAIQVLKVFAAKSGMNLTFEPEYENTNGWFDKKTNTLHISVGAGIKRSEGMLKDTIIPTASHEITHWMEEKSPELWEKLKNVALDALVAAYKADSGKDITQEDIIASEVKRLDSKHSKKKHTADDAVREIVARSCEDMLSMSEEGRKMFDTMSEAEQKTFKEKVMEIINNLKEWINELLSSYGTQSVEAHLLRNYKDKLEEMSKIWDEMLVRSIEVNQALEKADAFNHLENGISEDGTTIVGANNLQMSDKTYRDGGRDFLVKWLSKRKDLTQREKWDIVEQTDRIAELMRAIEEGNDLPDYSNWANMEVVKTEEGEAVSVIVSNGDYKLNIDFSQVCKKRVALDAILNAMVTSGDLNTYVLTETDISELNDVIKKHDFEIACALCFVDAKRYRVGAWADSFCEGADVKDGGKTYHKYGFNEMVRSLVPKGSKLNIDEFNFTNRDIENQPTKNLLSEADDSELDFTLIDKIMSENDIRSAQHRYARAIKENPEIRKILNSSEIISSIGLDNIRVKAPAVYKLINGHQGTAKPKFAHSGVAYGNNVLQARGFTAKSAKMVGGVRCQSFSDFMANMVVDYAQFVSELAAKKLTAHSYTKEPLFVKLFGLTGMKINMSLVPKAVDMTPEQQKYFAILKDKNADKKSDEYKAKLAEYEKLSENAGLDENGNYIWEDETFPYDIAMEIVTDTRYSKNCGTIAVGISNNHIRKLLADERISMVIPYHKSSLNHEVAMMRDIALYNDYTAYQNTRDKATGSKLDKDKGQKDFDFYGDLYGTKGKEGTHDPKKTAQNYLAWCDANNYIPKFDEFALNPNYYKLLIDFRVYDVDGSYVEQQPVQTIYPSNEEFSDLILNGVKDKDGKVYGGLKQQQETSDRLNAESQQIVNEFKQRLAEKYGEDVMQYSLKESAIKEIDQALSDKMYDKEIQLTDSSPSILTSQRGVRNLPMMMIASHVRENILTEEEARKMGLSVNSSKHYHGLGKELFVKVINELDEVTQAYRGTKNADNPERRENYFLLISQQKDAKGDVINVPVYVNEKGVYNRVFVDTNKVATVFGREEFSEYIKRELAKGNLVRIKKRSTQASESMSPIDSDYSKIASKDSILNPSKKSNEHSVNNEGNEQYSDKDTTSVYDVMGETERLRSENEQLRKDFADLQERLELEKQLTHGNYFNENSLGTVAGHLRNISNSSYDKVSLIGRLKEVYSYIAHSENVTWDEMFDMSYRIAEDMLKESKPDVVVNREYKRILNEIRNTKISLDATQISEAKYRFGNNYNRAFFNKVHLTSEGISLDTMWQDWAERYPDFFDADVSSGNQIGELYDIIESLQEASEIVEEYDVEEQTRWLATEIYNQYWNVSTIKTTADKYDRKIKLLNYQHRNRINALRESYNARAEKLKSKNKADREKYKNLVKEIRESKDKKVAEAKALGKQRMAEYKESVERKSRIQSITANTLTLADWYVTNSKDKHIPEVLKGPVKNLIDAIDFSSKRLLDKNIPTQKDISLAKALNKVRNMMTDASKGNADLVQLYGHNLDEDIEKMMDSIDMMDRTIADNEYILQKMSLEDLATLDKMVKAIKASVSKMNKFHIVNHAKGIASLSQTAMVEMDKLGKAKVYEGLRGKIDKTLMWNNAIPVYAFKRFGEAGTKVFEALQDGWDKFAFNVKKILDFAEKTYTSKEVEEWEATVKTFDIRVPATEDDLANPDYKPQFQKVQMTIPQIMSLHCLYKREQAKQHLIGGGIRVADFTVGNKVISQTDGLVFTKENVETIISTLSRRQVEVADKIQEFMNTVCSEWGNEVSMARFGIRQFGEENYFPIQSDKNNLAVDDETEKANSLFRLLNMSFSKSLTPGADNRIVISNIFDVFAQHSSDMAKYNALALPVLDTFRWYNYTEKHEVGDDAIKTNGVKQAMEKAFGSDGKNYFTTFLKDINGQKEVSRDTLGAGLFTNAKIAAVGANLRVVLLQPASYVRASAIIDNKYLTKALMFKPKTDKAQEHCGIAQWKALGYYDTNIQKGVADQIKGVKTWKDKAQEWSMWGAEKADSLTWGYLWNACELEIRDTRKDLKVGSKEFYDAISKRLREVIYTTQVVDSTMTRSQMMRSGQLYDKMLTSFASEPTLAYNMVVDAYVQFSLDKRRMSKGEAWRKNRTHIARVASAYIMTNAVAALVESAFDAYRDDDDEEKDLVYFMKTYLSNFAQDMSLVGKIPYIKDIVSIFQGYGASRTDIAWMESLYKALTGTWKLFTSDSGNPGKVAKNWVKFTSSLSGLPFYNLYRDTKLEKLITEMFEENSN